MPTISVILPFYNAESTLDKACQSISMQSFKDFECILIDNNSDDQSTLIANKWALKDPRFKLITEAKQGVSYASSKGSLLASGKYIARMDADDIMLKSRLELQKEFLETHVDYGAVGGLVKFGGDHQKARGIKRFIDWNNEITTFEEIALNQFAELPVINPTLMWRKEIEEKYGGYIHGNFPEDYELILRWLSQKVKIGKVANEVLIWNDPPTRLTRKDNRYSFDAFYKTKAQYLSKWLRENNPNFPKVYIWGASRLARKRAKYIEEHDIQIQGYIDISDKREIDEKIIHYKSIPSPEEAFILIYTPQKNIKKKIAKYLSDKGFLDGTHYLFAA
ncbi:MAG: glycosyl transferase family 2 [Salinivirgaceae bacterium]|nr:MAG: glycosyl transferase family 2 [Salinivirgaceae bacterium]